ncbi:MAG: TIR domain-containing protein [Verrucomicrobia bacterium]|nr:TIR domain-containing protein [Verrucomicrobiota bacterium]
MSADVFISYAAKDRERVLGLVKRLRDAGVTVWIDQAGIDVSTMWSQEIVNAIRDCKVMLLSISPHSTESENVVKELALASERKKPIIPVYLESADIPGTMEYQLAGIQRVEYFAENEDAAFRAMVRSLAKRGVTVDATQAGLEGDDALEASLAAHQSQTTAARKPLGLIAAAVVAGLAVAAFLLIPSDELKPSDNTEEPSQANPTQTDPPLGQAQTPPVEAETLSATKLAILPFKVLGTSDNEFIAEGMTMELISKLQPVSGLTVIASNSTMKFKESSLSPIEIGQQLNAGSLLRGTIQQGNEQLKVIVNLVDANSQEVKWSQSFDGSTKDMLKLQGDIAQSVAGELQLVLSPDELAKVTKRATENPEAYQEYLQGRIEWKKRSRQGFANAIQHFEKAIELDPNFALAYSGLADIYLVFPYWQIAPPTMAYPKARENAEKAKTLDPSLAEPWATLASLETVEHNWSKADKLFSQSISLNKNYATAWQWRGALMLETRSPKTAVEYANKAFELDPISPIISGALGRFNLYSNKPNAAIPHFQRAYNLSGKENINFIIRSALAYLRLNKAEKGIEVIEQHVEDITQIIPALSYTARCEARLGNKGRAYELLATLLHLKTTPDRYVSEPFIADIYAELGDKEKAFYWLNKAVEKKSPGNVMFTLKPVYDQWKDEPEYQVLLKKVNLDKP